MTRTITAYFDSRADAQRATDRLAEIGVAGSAVSIHDSTSTAATTTATTETGERKGFWASLGELFVPDEDRYTYEEGIRRGGSVLTVRAEENDFERVSDILEQSGSIDLDTRESEWRSEGWSGYDAATPRTDTIGTSAAGMTTGGYSGTLGGTATDTDLSSETRDLSERRDFAAGENRDDYIPIAEEKLRVGKREVDHGRVRVRSYVVETPVEENVSLRDERVNVERNAVDRAATSGDRLFQDRTIEADESVEEAVVSKDARVVEEVRLNKEGSMRDETVRDTVRRTEVEVDDERTGRTGSGSTLSEDELARRRRGA